MRVWEVWSQSEFRQFAFGENTENGRSTACHGRIQGTASYNFSLICLRTGWALKTEISKIIVHSMSSILQWVVEYFLSNYIAGVAGCDPGKSPGCIDMDFRMNQQK